MTCEEIETLLLELCAAAAGQTLPRFRENGAVKNKLEIGFDPVTDADKAAEGAIRQIILEKFPKHGILGEEEADHNIDAEYCWVIDPIDGTRAFISGLPTWGTLIGLNHRGRPIAGAMQQPFTGEIYLATSKGSVLHQNGMQIPLKTSSIDLLEQATLMTTDPNLFESDEQRRFDALRDACQLTRYGFDCYAYAMVAAGNIELVAESGLNAFDIAPLIPIIEQAGGIVTTWDGGDAARGGQVIAAANESIHSAAMDLIVKSA